MRISYFFIIIITMGLNGCDGHPVEKAHPEKTRYEHWIEDLDFFESNYLGNSKTYPDDSVIACKKRITNLKLRIDTLNDNQIILELSRCVAMADNGHTTMHLGWMKKIPVRFFWFSDGLYIIKTTDSLSQYLGARVIAINSIEPNEIQSKINPYLSGNNNWKEFTAVNYLCSPQILNGINLSDSNSLNLTLAINLDTISTRLNISAFSDYKYEYNAWENLYPSTSEKKDWFHVLDSVDNIPLYLQHSDKGAFYHSSSAPVSLPIST
ncbi:MAG: hypothetical protein R6X09_00645 [Bacteroidales bacterium]